MHYTYESHNIGLSLYSLNFTHHGAVQIWRYFTRGGGAKRRRTVRGGSAQMWCLPTNTKRERLEALKAPKMGWGRLNQLVGQTPFWTALNCWHGDQLSKHCYTCALTVHSVPYLICISNIECCSICAARSTICSYWHGMRCFVDTSSLFTHKV